MKTRFLSLSSQVSNGCRGALIVAAVAGWMLAVPPVWAQDGFNAANAEASQAAEISQEVLDGLLAPIALYPDALLAQVLMAATYPMDVIEASRWQRDHSNLSGQALQDAMASFDWDPSVKSLVTVPQVLQYMNDEPRWMQDLGQAVIADQPRVMESVQALRQKAYAAGSLTSNDKQTVGFDTGTTSQTQYITIAPASPQVVYVPVYDPMVVYGNWWWPSRPVCWGPPLGVGFSAGFYWGPGFYPSLALWGGFNWGFGMITINAPMYSSYYRMPPPMMGPRNAWRRPPPVYAAPIGGHYRRPPYSPQVVRPLAPRPPSYAPGPNSPRPSARPPSYQGTPPVAGRPHGGSNNAQPPARPMAPPNGAPSADRPRGNASGGAAPGGGPRSSGGQPVMSGNNGPRGNGSQRSAGPSSSSSRGDGPNFQQGGGGGGFQGGGGGGGRGGR